MGVNHGSAVLFGIKRRGQKQPKSLVLKHYVLLCFTNCHFEVTFLLLTFVGLSIQSLREKSALGAKPGRNMRLRMKNSPLWSASLACFLLFLLSATTVFADNRIEWSKGDHA